MLVKSTTEIHEMNYLFDTYLLSCCILYGECFALFNATFFKDFPFQIEIGIFSIQQQCRKTQALYNYETKNHKSTFLIISVD